MYIEQISALQVAVQGRLLFIFYHYSILHNIITIITIMHDNDNLKAMSLFLSAYDFKTHIGFAIVILLNLYRIFCWPWLIIIMPRVWQFTYKSIMHAAT